MQILPLTTQLPPLSPIPTADTPHPPPLFDGQGDRVELSGQHPLPLGQAESLPVQGEAPEVIGLCPHCGRVHAMSVDSAEGAATL